jgi:hypothetical protein
MPTIPRYLEQESPSARAYVRHVQPPDIGRAFGPWQEAAREWEETQRRLTDAQDALDLATITSGVRQDMVEVSHALTESGDPVNRGPRFMAAMQERAQARLAQYQNKDARFTTVAQARMTQLIGEQAAAEQAAGFGIQHKNLKAGALVTLKDLAGAGTPRAIAEGDLLIETHNKIGLWSPGEYTSLKESLRKESAANAAARDIVVDAYGAADRIAAGEGVYGSLAEADRKSLADHARKEGDRQQIQFEQQQAATHASALKELEQLEKEQERRWGQNEVDLMADFFDNPLTDRRVIIQAARAGKIKPDFTTVNQFANALKSIRDQANEKDDPDTLTDVDTRVYDVRGPQITTKQLLAHRTANRISDQTYRRSLIVLRDWANLMRAEGQTKATAQTQIQMGAYTAGKQAIEDYFTTIGAMASSDKEQITVLKGQALHRFWELTKGGRLEGVDPTEALPVVMNQFRSVGTGVAKILLREIPAQYRHDPRKLKADFEAGLIKPDEYRRWRDFLVGANDIVPMTDWEQMNRPDASPILEPQPTPKPATGGRRAPKP